MSDTPPLPRERRRTTKGLRPLSVLVRDLVAEVRRLIAAELALFKAEMTAKAKEAGLGVGLLVGALVFAFFALCALVTTAVLAFALIVPAWAAALIVAGILLLLAVIAILIGRASLKKVPPIIPEDTVASIGEDFRALKGDRA